VGVRAGVDPKVLERIFLEVSSTGSPAGQLKVPKIIVGRD
jgi:hypothetical protein